MQQRAAGYEYIKEYSRRLSCTLFCAASTAAFHKKFTKYKIWDNWRYYILITIHLVLVIFRDNNIFPVKICSLHNIQNSPENIDDFDN